MSDASISYPADVQAAVEDHCFSRVDVEVGGFLIGRLHDTGTQIVHAHPALTATSAQTHLTITHEAWDEVLPLMETDYAGMAIVGWYHSHPGFGVFLSDYDIFIQENFFSSPGQVALVVDPIDGTYGFLTAGSGEWSQLQGGKTRLPAKGTGSVDKVDAMIAVESPRRRRALMVVGGILLGIVSLAAGWFVGTLQGQEQGRSSAQNRIDALTAEVDRLRQEQVDPSPTPTPTPTPTPAPTPDPTPAPAPGPTPGAVVTVDIDHVMRPGQTLWSLAAAYLGSGEEYPRIIAVNPGIDPRNVQPGIIVKIPVTGVLTAEEG